MAWLLTPWILVLGLFDLPTRVIRKRVAGDLTGLTLDRPPQWARMGQGLASAELGARLSALWLSSNVLFRASPPKHGRIQLVIRRGLHLVVGWLFLIATLPIWMAIAVMIASSSCLPIFFKRKRVTKGDRPFTMLKFWTRRKRANRLLSGAHADQTARFFKLEGDPRLTKIGAPLRRFSLDKLAQLPNVLRGDISLVGPRPLPLEQVEANRELLTARHEVRAV
jgi:lipopolysaccharide/colanic/teichoic acid biosynthesis glycosyltransferase